MPAPIDFTEQAQQLILSLKDDCRVAMVAVPNDLTHTHFICGGSNLLGMALLLKGVEAVADELGIEASEEVHNLTMRLADLTAKAGASMMEI